MCQGCYRADVRREQRLSAILDRVGADGQVDVATLADQLGVSGATVRRDLQALSRSQLLVRTHGGATSAQSGEEVPMRVKAALRLPEKRRIGRAAADLIADGSVVGLTGGSTTRELGRALAGRRGITVVTNAIDIAGDLASGHLGALGIRLVVIGGIVRHSLELVGPAAEAMLANYHLDVAFVGADGLTAQDGCTTYDEMEAQTDAAFLRRADRRVVIADSTKLGRATFARIADLTDLDDLVTDRGADEARLAELRAAGLRVTTV